MTARARGGVDLSDPAAVRAEAERRQRARAEGRPLTGAASVPVTREDDTAREKETQAAVVKLFRAFGCRVYNLSQARRTKQTPGLPDLWVVHVARGLAWWWETKRPDGGRLSSAQLDFRMECAMADVPHGVGSLADAEDFLIALGFCRRNGDTLDPCPVMGAPEPSPITPLQAAGFATIREDMKRRRRKPAAAAPAPLVRGEQRGLPAPESARP